MLARLALAFVSFPRLAKRLGTFTKPTTTASGPSEHVAMAAQIGWAVKRAAHYVPFRAVCLPQALAARIMLKRRGVASVLHFAVGKMRGPGDGDRYEAHAWLDAAGVEVTGYPVAKGFSEIGCFV